MADRTDRAARGHHTRGRASGAAADHPDAVEWLATGPGRLSAAAIELARELLGRTT
ncbi:hypothetical protein [Streptomyces stelliscabiei]|uniref:hypothetical protein n=1 Tax=Streptomyces stelliscabiei TaxID=146820 RepID=UPI003EB77A6C